MDGQSSEETIPISVTKDSIIMVTEDVPLLTFMYLLFTRMPCEIIPLPCH